MAFINTYFCEGKTESVLVDRLKVERLIPSGKTKIANIWNIDIKRKYGVLLRRNVSNIAYVIFDTDDVRCTDVNKIEGFIQNALYLSKCCKSVYLLPQSLNFEDEVTYACGMNQNLHLYRAMYNTNSKSEFKNRFISDSDPLTHLNNNGYDNKRMWVRDESFKVLLGNRNLPKNIYLNFPR